ncbi:uncharacterized protein LOC127804244 [Diospyros lotus]|uniref:uncharacterized protein LOC127804244 n=1 Tax=Diospyros lotus TaxID=55363 RepID=UPI00225848F0|nr:uncharacterized protein LOC127804244 [Diospyros lotus]
MAGDEMLSQEIEGKNLPTSSIDRNRSLDEGQEQETAEREIPRQRLITPSRNGPWIRKISFRQIFYKAVRGGQLYLVKMLLEYDKTLLGTKFTKFEENALQVAVVSGQEKIFSKLMEEDGSNNIVKEKNMYGETILTLAAAQGNIKIVKRLVGTCDELADIPNDNGDLPITVAALFGNKEIVYFLFDLTLAITNLFVEEEVNMTNSTQSSVDDGDFKFLKVSMTTQVCGRDERNYSFKLVNEDKDEAYKPAYLSGYHSFRLFKACISSQLYDLAYKVFQESPTLCINEMVKENGKTIHPLARVFMKKPIGQWFIDWCFEFDKNGTLGIDFPWTRIEKIVELWHFDSGARKLLRQICMEILESENRYEIIQKVLSRPILIAVEQDNTSFTDAIREFHPDALWVILDELSNSDMALSKDLFKIYISALKNPETGLLRTIRADRNGNTILHHAALLSSTKKLSRFPSPSLQMQSEIQWFKKVEKILPMCKGVENKDNLIPMDLFVQEHRKLKKAGGKWLKETASSCSVVATLIITIMFSATFTVPGGYDNDTGIPINLGSKYFTIFIISDALSLFLSCTSAMLFLRIYTLDFQDEDFLIKLPLTLTFGIFTLFLSIVTMVIAFSAAFFLTLRETLESMTLPVFMLASIPVIVYSASYLWIFINVLRLTLHHLFNR